MADDPDVPFPFDYDEFSRWYDSHHAGVLIPALAAADQLLGDTLAEVLSERERARVRPGISRVKSKQRTWRKLHQPEYRHRLGTLEEIPQIIDDLIGMRLICTNSRDIDTAQIALDTLPRVTSVADGLLLDPSTERDYISEPKPSGYRGYHVNVWLSAPQLWDSPVCCELQVRTLLQDGWGELTHEDSYKTDGPVPPLVSVLSSRMADLLATLDAIADDLRSELDRLDDAAVVGSRDADGASTDGTADASTSDDPQASSASAELRRHWEELDQPVELTTLAWELQREFGPDISGDWFGARSFKKFLQQSVPEGEITDLGQPYLMPMDFNPGGDDADADAAQAPDATDGEVPVAAQRLRRVDRSFPLLDAEDWQTLYRELAVAWAQRGDLALNNKTLNQITRSARDRSEANGRPVSRRSLDHVAKAVMFADPPPDPLPAHELATAFADQVVGRMTALGLVDDDQQVDAVRRWLYDAST